VRSSNFSEPDATFADFLGRSLSLLRREIPWVYARMCGELEPREVLIWVDDLATSVLCEAAEVRILDAPQAPDVELRTTSAEILDLIDAERTLVEAILAGRITLRGRVDDLIAFHDGLVTYLHGAVRSPSFPPLLASFRRARAGAPRRGPIIETITSGQPDRSEA
jgi:hypothetical protein